MHAALHTTAAQHASVAALVQANRRAHRQQLNAACHSLGLVGGFAAAVRYGRLVNQGGHFMPLRPTPYTQLAAQWVAKALQAHGVAVAATGV